MDNKILKEIGSVSKNTSGRKKILLNINPHYKKAIGIDINSKYTNILITYLDGELLYEYSLKTDLSLSPYDFLKSISSFLKQILSENNISESEILGIGVSILGGVNKYKNTTNYPIGFWNEEVPVKELLENFSNLPVIVDNNVNNLAILELFSGHSLTDFFFLKYGVGIGGTIVSDGKIHYGYNSLAGEVGHTIQQPKGNYCPMCKRRGCLESTISHNVMINKIKEDFNKSSYPLLYDLCEGHVDNITISIILKAAELGSIKICEYLRFSSELIAVSIINIISFIDPEKIILCGELFENNLYLNYFYSNIYNLQLVDMKDRIQISKITKDMEKFAPAVSAINQFFYENLLGN